MGWQLKFLNVYLKWMAVIHLSCRRGFSQNGRLGMVAVEQREGMEVGPISTSNYGTLNHTKNANAFKQNVRKNTGK